MLPQKGPNAKNIEAWEQLTLLVKDGMFWGTKASAKT